MIFGQIELTNALITAAAGIAGVGIGWGALKARTDTNTRDIQQLNSWRDLIDGIATGQPRYANRGDCGLRHEHLTDRLATMDRRTQALRNFAYWILTKRENQSPREANDILGDKQ